MNAVEILEQTGKIELNELASLFLPNPAVGTEEGKFVGDVCEEDCAECERDQEERMKCKFRNAIVLFEVD